MKNIQIHDEYITLGQFLKIADLVSTGGETKIFLMENEIKVNDIPDNRRGKKLYKGDIVSVLGETYTIC
ncbi:MAG: S4 domain-containing protein YaaA [Erysipelotrichaceae bacterium]|nr:S4 domain-containing protein YaaA [Erysipelotrichaceae bacterium]